MTPKTASPREAEIIREIESYKERRKQLIATILISVFGIYILPFLTLIYLLGIVAFVIAPAIAIYYTWKKRQLEDELEEIISDREPQPGEPNGKVT